MLRPPKFAVAIAAALILVPTAGFAASATPAASPATPSIYVQLLGGLADALPVLYQGQQNFATNYGGAVAGTVGVVVMDGLSVEGDFQYTDRNYNVSDWHNVTTLSAMANLKYTMGITDSVGVYVAGGGRPVLFGHDVGDHRQPTTLQGGP